MNTVAKPTKTIGEVLNALWVTDKDAYYALREYRNAHEELETMHQRLQQTLAVTRNIQRQIDSANALLIERVIDYINEDNTTRAKRMLHEMRTNMLHEPEADPQG